MDVDTNLSQGASLPEVAVRLTVAALVGALIGWERERLEKPAGLRTHMLVALGSASFTLLGFEVGAHLSPKTGEGFDPTRVLQGVIGGIGFLGAGSIIQNRGQVSGITTAASVWVVGALGAAAGVGAYVLAALTALFAFTILFSLARFERRIAKSSAAKQERTPDDQDETRSREDGGRSREDGGRKREDGGRKREDGGSSREDGGRGKRETDGEGDPLPLQQAVHPHE